MELILASASPRRKELLQQLRYEFTVKVSDVDENISDETMSPTLYVRELAKRKAKAVFDENSESCVVAADTIVLAGGKILGKPQNDEEATEMLQLLSGKNHHVLTGVAVMSPMGEHVFHEQTKVTFHELTTTEIRWYLGTGEHEDKAGSYGIQGFGAFFVKSIEGDYNNIVGLPLAATARALRVFDIPLPRGL